MVANAGLLLVATLAVRLGLERLIDEAVRLGERPGAGRAGAKVLSLVHAMLLGADSIDDCGVLRAGESGRVLGHRVLAPSTLGTFLRSFTFGHVRQLDRVLAEALRRAWSAGAGPGSGRLVIDVDSFVCEVHGSKKQGAAYGYTHKLGYHPIIATRSDTLETLHIRLRKGSANTQRGAQRFVNELIARVRRAGAVGEILVRADSGFWSYDTIAALERLKVRYSIGVTIQAHVRAAIEQIPEAAWQRLPGYPATSIAEIAETLLGERRLIVRRTRLLGAQAALWPDWRHHAFITDRTEALALVEAEHRQHAVVELAIRDHKDGPLRHAPSGHYAANAAWCVIAALAANLARWVTLLGLKHATPQAAATMRRRLLVIPARLVRHGRRLTLRLPARWPWHEAWIECLTRLRGLPALR
ncbi:MAG: IS1380 family transposase [Actinomycetota bacterium]|nr:IS1380 family transposase [Actinomycetota bacterium]